jgi:hypothetical protein
MNVAVSESAIPLEIDFVSDVARRYFTTRKRSD